MADKIIQLHDELGNNIYPITTLDAFKGSGALTGSFVQKSGDIMTGDLAAPNFIGNLTGNANTASKVAWNGITDKPNYYDAQAIKEINKNGSTITYTHMDGSQNNFTIDDNDTKNTAGATNTQNKIYLIGATEQSENPRTYSHDGVYIGEDGCLYSNNEKVVTGDVEIDGYLPLTAGKDKPLVGPLGLTAGQNYGATLPASGFTGQLFFLEDTGAILPTGGTTGQYLVKNSSAENDASWQTLTTTVSNTVTGGTSNGPTIKTTVNGVTGAAVTIPAASASASGVVTTGTQTFAGAKTFNSNLTVSGTSDIYSKVIGTNGNIGMYVSTNRGLYDFAQSKWIIACDQASTKVYSGYPIYGAVWNDYAEYRSQKEIIEPGYCVASADNGKVYKTTEKFQACDGIVSDTAGFFIGQTDECQTPLAVAGRVLAYFHGERSDYHSGDTVCAGPEGKVMKMTREEIREWPDRIIGIVSEIPEYATWGSGNVAVNGRIWIKVK